MKKCEELRPEALAVSLRRALALGARSGKGLARPARVHAWCNSWMATKGTSRSCRGSEEAEARMLRGDVPVFVGAAADGTLPRRLDRLSAPADLPAFVARWLRHGFPAPDHYNDTTSLSLTRPRLFYLELCRVFPGTNSATTFLSLTAWYFSSSWTLWLSCPWPCHEPLSSCMIFSVSVSILLLVLRNDYLPFCPLSSSRHFFVSRNVQVKWRSESRFRQRFVWSYVSNPTNPKETGEKNKRK